jgi:preprotein translocase subunit YajC
MTPLLAAASTTSSSGGGLTLLLPLVLMGAVFYFLLIRPQKKKMTQQKSLLESLEVGDEVVTIGGIFGTLQSIGVDGDDDQMLVEIAPGTTIRVVRAAIARKHIPDQDDEHEEPWYEDMDPELPEEQEEQEGEGAQTGS